MPSSHPAPHVVERPSAATSSLRDVPPARPARPRALWMDGLRGLAILLIVELHASAIMRMHGINPAPVLEWLDAAANPFRIPMLMLLSGMLLPASMAKGPRRYLVGKVRMILWPYVVWSIMLVLAYDFIPWSSLLTFLLVPSSHLWYLHTVFVAYVIALLLRRVPTWITALGAFAIAAVLPLLELPEWLEQTQPVRLCMMLGYFMVGATIKRHWDVVERQLRRWWVTAALVVVGLVAAGLAAAPDISISYRSAVNAPLVLASVLGVVAVAIRLRWTSPPARALRTIGRDSLVYYVTHWFVIMAVVWPLWLVPDFVPFDVQMLAVAAALLCAAVVASLSHRLRVVGIFFRL